MTTPTIRTAQGQINGESLSACDTIECDNPAEFIIRREGVLGKRLACGRCSDAFESWTQEKRGKRSSIYKFTPI